VVLVGAIGPCLTYPAQASTAPLNLQRQAPSIMVIGDSISAEYGLSKGDGWVPLLQKRLAANQINANVINASVSGDTTSGGRARLPSLLQRHRPDIVIVELGGNDALRGLPLANTQQNLTDMVQAAQKSGAQVVLAGIEVPPNYGSTYAAQFNQIFAAVAKANNAALVPSILKGVADAPDPTALFQKDRIHPNAQAQSLLLDNVWPTLKALLNGKNLKSAR
jgi:acyl-CoA thioesterase-1